MLRSITLCLILGICSNYSFSQIIGDNQLGASAPTEISKDGQTKGALQGNVNLFDGTYNSTYNLGTVSEPSGLSYSLNLSYQSSVMTGSQLPLTEGIPYGSGWNIGTPMITVSSEDFNNYSKRAVDEMYNSVPRTSPPYYEANSTDPCAKAKTEGQLMWFAPKLNIPGVASGRMVLHDVEPGKWTFTLHEFDQLIYAYFDGKDWEVKLPNGVQYEFVGMVTHRSPSGRRVEGVCMDDPDVFQNYAAPKSEVTAWYCTRMFDRNKVGNIRFIYKGYGKFDFNKVLSQGNNPNGENH